MKKYFLTLLSIMFVAATSVGFVSCGDDDEEEKSVVSSASLEGTWHLMSETWYKWKDGQINTSKEPSVYTHSNPNDEMWTFSKTDGGFSLTVTRTGKSDTWVQDGTNAFRNRNGEGRDRAVVKSVNGNTLEVELYDGYYGEGDEVEKTKEYGLFVFQK